MKEVVFKRTTRNNNQDIMSTRRNERDDMTTGDGGKIEHDGSGRERVKGCG